MEDKFFTIGKAIGIFGLKGELIVKCLTDFPSRFKPGLTVYITSQKQGEKKLTIESIKKNGTN
jgi:ribosomal 30S subunit maturation factor RimM